jgi:hypothetical protein
MKVSLYNLVTPYRGNRGSALSAYIVVLEDEETAGKGRKACFQDKNEY